MADLDDRLDRLISDQESMRKVLEMAKTILAQRDSAASVSASDPSAKTEEPTPTINNKADKNIFRIFIKFPYKILYLYILKHFF